jgi:hypothetical protein
MSGDDFQPDPPDHLLRWDENLAEHVDVFPPQTPPGEASFDTSGQFTGSFMGRCSTPPASGSSPSVSALVSLSTSPLPWLGISQHGQKTSSPMGSTLLASVTPKSGRSLIRLGCLRTWCCDPQTYPVRLPFAGGRAGE